MKALFSQITIIVAVTFVSLTLSSQAHSKEVATPIDRGSSAEGFEILASIKKTDVNTSEPVIIQVVLKNTTGKQLVYNEGVRTRDFKIIVEDDKGRDLAFTIYGNHLFGDERTSFAVGPGWPTILEGGQEVRYEFVINRMYDMSKGGTYSVRVKRLFLRANASKLIIAGQHTSQYDEIISNTVKFKVVEPSPPRRTRIKMSTPFRGAIFIACAGARD